MRLMRGVVSVLLIAAVASAEHDGGCEEAEGVAYFTKLMQAVVTPQLTALYDRISDEADERDQRMAERDQRIAAAMADLIDENRRLREENGELLAAIRAAAGGRIPAAPQRELGGASLPEAAAATARETGFRTGRATEGCNNCCCCIRHSYKLN